MSEAQRRRSNLLHSSSCYIPRSTNWPENRSDAFLVTRFSPICRLLTAVAQLQIHLGGLDDEQQQQYCNQDGKGVRKDVIQVRKEGHGMKVDRMASEVNGNS
jgi:hypothetical protein